jgi:hypothetical protein
MLGNVLIYSVVAKTEIRRSENINVPKAVQCSHVTRNVGDLLAFGSRFATRSWKEYLKKYPVCTDVQSLLNGPLSEYFFVDNEARYPP